MTIDEKRRLVTTFRGSPEIFARKVCKVETWWDGMTKICNAVAEHDKVVVHSGHSLSKDFLGGRLPLWFLCSYYPARVIMTAPSERQVKHIMWAELSQAYEDAGGRQVIGGDLKSCLLDMEPNRHFALAFTTKETKGQTGKFQGLKAPNVLIIVSEAQAVDDTIFDQIEGISTAANTKILLLGNPLQNTGFFAKAIRNPKFGYFPVHLNCLDNPNYKERREVIPGLASYQWVEDMRRKYGEDSPMWQGRVLGIVPDCSIDTVIPYNLLELAVDKPLIIELGAARRVVSIDPASFGDDECIIQVLEEGRILKQVTTAKQRTNVTAADAMLLHKEFNADGYVVDTVGEGRGVADSLVAAKEDPVIEYKGSYGAENEEDFYNLRAESHFYAKDQFETGFCSIPQDQLLMEELAETKYVTRKGKIIIEDKDEIKKRLGRSPNRADAYIMGLWALKTLQKRKKKEDGSWKSDAKGRMWRNRNRSVMTA